MNFNNLYKYSFYILYKTNCFSTSWGADWRAVGLLMMTGIYFVIPIALYLGILFSYRYSDNALISLFAIAGIILCSINYKTFFHNDQWKEIITKYDKWPDKKNIIRGVLVCLMMLAIFANFLLSLYLYKSIILWH